MNEYVIIVRSHDDGEVYCVLTPADPLNPQFTVDEVQSHMPDAIIETFEIGTLSSFIEYDDHMSMCGQPFTTGGFDPYGTSCDLKHGHEGPHEGDDPFGTGGRVQWEGGGSCAGDPLPQRNVKFIPKEEESNA